VNDCINSSQQAVERTIHRSFYELNAKRLEEAGVTGLAHQTHHLVTSFFGTLCYVRA
jgi:hypothetical protein